MILTGPEIVREREAGRLTIEPFDPKQVNPNSYNLTLGPTLVVYTGTVLDTRRPNAYETLEIPEQGIILEPDRIYLGSSVEVIGSDHYVPVMHSRSGSARLGIYSHVTADLIDQGSRGQLTHQLRVVQRVRVYAGVSLAQVDFRQVQGEPMLYCGKYQGSRGPQPSQIHRDADTLGTAA
ncbi:dCTP deaminase [Kitasatospora phosalacinea]|uniref:dCTP deaminase n=1 Tax=Kitasatospora phosalacinea TaxID=2065 RepID=A0A9W6PP11_9ACTN|nr:deoxycytidine triphosphate deaminase [Kitasatospora phosalacinea]GLW58536.1 dCTP deaminase [Kitasatospora phosalacinea]